MKNISPGVNYVISDATTYIDIYPSKLEYTMENGTKITIEDKEGLFVIPIELYNGEFSVGFINSSSIEYPTKYKQVQKLVNRSVKILGFYDFKLVTEYGNKINLKTLSGSTVTIRPVSRVAGVYNVDSASYEKMKYNYKDKTVTFTIGEDYKNEILILQSKTYFAIWKIILIVVLILILLILLIILVIIYRRLRKEKRAGQDKI